MVWRCACDLDIIVRLFFVTPHCELIIFHFFTSIYRQWVPLVSATPLTVLYWLFWNFAYVFFMVWGCAFGLRIIVRTCLLLFPHFELSLFSPSVGCACGLDIIVSLCFVTFSTLWTVIFHPLYVNSWYILWAPLTVLYRLLWNFACIFFMVWGCACGLDVIVKLFFYFFPHCELSHFSPSIYRQWLPREHNSSYNFILIFLQLCTCFLLCLQKCMWFGSDF